MKSLLLMRDKNTATKNEQAQRFLGHADVTMLLWKLICDQHNFMTKKRLI